MIAGLFFGFAFGMGGIGAVVIGWIADLRGIQFAFQLCALLPAIGLWSPSCPTWAENARSAALRAPERLARLLGRPPVLQSDIGDQMGAEPEQAA